MQNNMPGSSWKSVFRKGFERKYVELVLYSYKEVLNMKPCDKPWEDTRRNMLLDQMRKNKGLFGITFHIGSEEGVFDENYRDNGRIDICCYLSQLEDDYIAFECKRFLKEDIIPSYIRDAYYGEGIKRFEDNIYADKVDFGGMIAFLEEGDYQKLWQRLVQELPRYTSDGNVCDISNTYGYQYILQTRHDRKSGGDIVLIHILMDFT